MKLVGIVGSNAEVSYNRILLKYIKKQFSHLFDLEILEIKDIPLFNQSDDQTNSAPVQIIRQQLIPLTKPRNPISFTLHSSKANHTNMGGESHLFQ